MPTAKAIILVAAVVGACGLVPLSSRQTALAAEPSESSINLVPNVYGGGILMAYSGLDGKTSWAESVTASTTSDTVGLRIHVSGDPVLRIYVPAPGMSSLKWSVVSNSVLVAYVPWDTLPLVIGFSSNNMIVGRLPPSCRVGLEGGNPSSQLHRLDRGDRTIFAYAYDRRGPKEATAAAMAGLKVSIDTLAESRLDFIQAAPKTPPTVDRLRQVTLAKAFSVLKVNLYSPEDPVVCRWSTPARWPQRDLFLWDAAFHGIGLMHLDVPLAKEVLQAAFAYQTQDGFIPQRMSPGQKAEISQPPILGWAVWQVYTYDKMRDRPFLEKSFEAVQKHVTWFMRNRRIDGPPPPEKALEHGTPLYAWKSAEESGVEGSPRFENGPQFAAIDLSCYLANECWTLQAMAQRLGYRELAKTWGQRGDAIAEAARRQLWNAQDGFFFDRTQADGDWVRVWSYAGLLPLWSGVATPEQAARIKEHLVGPKFWTALPVAMVARDDPKFSKDIGCGAAAMNVNYLVLRGLQRYGFTKEADDLRERSLAAVTDWYSKTGALFEFYDCEGQTAPSELARKGASGAGLPNTADYGWTAATYIDLLLRPKP